MSTQDERWFRENRELRTKLAASAVSVTNWMNAYDDMRQSLEKRLEAVEAALAEIAELDIRACWACVEWGTGCDDSECYYQRIPVIVAATRSRGDGAAVTHSSAETPGGGGTSPDSPTPAPEER